MKRVVLNLGKGGRFVLLGAVYAALLVAALWLAFELRFDFAVPERMAVARMVLLGPVVAVQLLLLILARQFGTLLSYFSLPDLLRLAMAMAAAALFFSMFQVVTVDTQEVVFPRGVVLINFVLAVSLLASFRVGLRVYHERYRSRPSGRSRGLLRLAIVGAGDVGAALARELLAQPARGFRPVVFFDDDARKHGKIIHGIPVAGAPEDLQRVSKKVTFSHVVIAMPSASAKRSREVIEMMSAAGRRVEIVPSLHDIASGKVKVSRLRPVDVEDLLGREPVNLDGASIRGMIENRVVVVTGAGGSIGGELCRQVMGHNPRRLIMLEQSEGALFQIEQELLRAHAGSPTSAVVADILDEARIDEVMERYKPAIIFHAAAHKHVYLMERQPGEAVKNNVLGTLNLADAAIKHGVRKFVFISTDKAINPTSVMGASKRLAELILIGRQRRADNPTKFCAVRFGNVLGSSGSVVPIFRRQIADGGPVTVTHPDVTRYFMTIPEAVGLVLQASSQGTGGEIFVLDMGQQVKIVDLARQMILLSGLRPDEDIDIEFTGLKPGEKLYEELQHFSEEHETTDHSRIRRLIASPEGCGWCDEIFAELRGKLDRGESNEIKEIIQRLVPEYTPHLE
ncbi:MAG: polysaccharide biosynthesis protein [Opitutales bacterium]|nr:polysaccharide biosynthesis protein [Opitutales bacterium]